MAEAKEARRRGAGSAPPEFGREPAPDSPSRGQAGLGTAATSGPGDGPGRQLALTPV